MYRPLTVQPTQPAPETQISFGRAWMLWIELTATWDTGAGITSNISDVSEAKSQILPSRLRQQLDCHGGRGLGITQEVAFPVR